MALPCTQLSNITCRAHRDNPQVSCLQLHHASQGYKRKHVNTGIVIQEVTAANNLKFKISTLNIKGGVNYSSRSGLENLLSHH